MLVNVTGQALHETGHLLVYQVYRRNPTWGFIGIVQRWDTPPLDPDHWVKISAPDGGTGWLRLGTLPDSKIEKAVAAVAGPIASLLGVVFGLWIAYKSDRFTFKYTGLMLALVISFSMALYYLRSPLRSIGDEYDLAAQLGIAKLGVEIPFALAFVFCFGLGLRSLNSWQVKLKWIASILVGSVTTGILLSLADGWVREMVNAGSPFFQSVLGYSLPVLFVYLITFVGILAWEYDTRKVLAHP